VSLELLLIALCLVGHAFYAGIETGMISIHRMRLRHFVKQGAPEASMIEAYLHDSDRLLGTTLVGTNLCVVIISVVAASLAVEHLGARGEAISTVGVAVTVLVLGEYLPKAWFHSRPLDRCRRMIRALRASEIVFRPVSWVIVRLTRLLVPGDGGGGHAFSRAAPLVTREDLKVLAREGEQDGVLSPRERVMIHRVIELSGKPASQVMVPLEKIARVRADMTVEEFLASARDSGFTRYPVYDETRGVFVGIINVFFVLTAKGLDRHQPVASFIRPPQVVPETMPVDDILPRMRRARQPMCLVANAAGVVTGLVTTEDILEEVVGAL
jgi:putative hemolysin